MAEPPFDTYDLPVWGRTLATLCRRIPAVGAGKRLAFILRKPLLWAGQSPVDVRVAGARFRLYPQENLSDKRLLGTPDLLDGPERRLLARLLKPGESLIDVGANIGGYCLLLTASRPDLRVAAVEADPEIAERLRTNVGFSGFEDRVEVLNLAVTRTEGPVKLQRDRVNRGKSAVMAAPNGADVDDGSVRVPGLPLLEILKLCGIQRPGAVKLDIEGHEFDALGGFFDRAPRQRWPRLLQLEQHRREPLNDAVRLTLARGYREVLRTRMNVVLTQD